MDAAGGGQGGGLCEEVELGVPVCDIGFDEFGAEADVLVGFSEGEGHL